MDAEALRTRTVIVTRGVSQSSPLRRELEARGATVVCVPAIRFDRSPDLRDWQAAIARCRAITHVVFTSQVAVRYFLTLSDEAGLSRDFWRERRLAALGDQTARALEEAGLSPDFRPPNTTGIDLAVTLVEREGVGPGCVVLLPQSDLARPDVADYLRAAGAMVHATVVYETRPETPEKAAPLLTILDAGGRIDAVTFASPSSLQGLLDLTGARGRQLLEATDVRLVSIGPTTSQAIRDAGLEVAAQASEPGVRALADAVARAVRET